MKGRLRWLQESSISDVEKILHEKIVCASHNDPLLQKIQQFNPITLRKKDLNKIVVQHLADVAAKVPERMHELYSRMVFIIDVDAEKINCYPLSTFIQGVDSYFVLIGDSKEILQNKAMKFNGAGIAY